jgi:hypothetical protein
MTIVTSAALLAAHAHSGFLCDFSPLQTVSMNHLIIISLALSPLHAHNDNGLVSFYLSRS